MDHFHGKSLPNASLVEASGEKTKMNRERYCVELVAWPWVAPISTYNIIIIE